MSIFSNDNKSNGDNIQFMVYGASLVLLWLSVLIISAVDTYKEERRKLKQRRDANDAFSPQPRDPATTARSPLELTQNGIKSIQIQRKQRSVNGLSVSSQSKEPPNSFDTPVTTPLSVHPPLAERDSDEINVAEVAMHVIASPDSPPMTPNHISKDRTSSMMEDNNVRYDMEINTAILEGGDHDESDDDYISPLALPPSKYRRSLPAEGSIRECCYICCGSTEFFKKWCQNMLALRAVYTTILVHIFDYYTDIVIILQWCRTAIKQIQNNTAVADNGVNMILLAGCAIFVMVMHRVVGFVAVLNMQRKEEEKQRGRFYAVLQFFDVYIFVEVWNSHKEGQRTERLKWLLNLESIFEASWQIMLQTIYLLQATNDWSSGDDVYVAIGLFFSTIRVGSTAILNDSRHVTKESNTIRNRKFWLRVIFRVAEIIGRQLMFVLIWIVVGEYFLGIILLFNFVHDGILYSGGCLSRQWFNVMGHIVSLSQLSFTIVEGVPWKVYRRGKLYVKGDKNYTDGDTRSKLKMAHSIFITNYKKARAKRHQQRRRHSIIHHRASHKISGGGRSLLLPSSNETKYTNTNHSNNTSKKPRLHALSTADSVSVVASHVAMSLSVSRSLTQNHNNHNHDGGHQVLNSNSNRSPAASPSASDVTRSISHSTSVSRATELRDPNMSKAVELNTLQNYLKSTGELDGCYSSIWWLQSALVWYFNIYLGSQRPQQIMMIQRTVEGLFWWIVIAIYGALRVWVSDDFGSVWRIHSGDESEWMDEYKIALIVMWSCCGVGTVTALYCFKAMMEHRVIKMISKKEETRLTTVFEAIELGRLDAIINQFDQKTVLQKPRKLDQKTPLYLACENGQDDIVEWLIAKDFMNVNIGAGQNRTPIHVAAKCGHTEIVRTLLAVGDCQYNKPNDAGRTPLYASCKEGHYEVVVLLLSMADININQPTNNNTTALGAACSGGHRHIVRELLSRQEILVNTLNKSDYTPIFLAALGCHEDVVEMLLGHEGIEIDHGCKNGETLFYVSCERGMDTIVKALLNRDDYDVNVNEPNAKQYTPLYIAACFGHADIIRILMNEPEGGAKALNEPDSLGRTPFFIACRRGRSEAVNQLLEYDEVDIHQPDNDEITPFAAACMGGSVEVVERLMPLVDREEIVGRDRLNRTPFFLAAREDRTEVVKRLMALEEIDVNLTDSLGRTALYIAVKRGNTKCVEALCQSKTRTGNNGKKYKVDVNRTDSEGRSPLFVAAKSGDKKHKGVVKALLSRDDLDVNVRCRAAQGKTALQIACELSHSRIVMMLLEHKNINVTIEDDNHVSPLAAARLNQQRRDQQGLPATVYMRMAMMGS